MSAEVSHSKGSPSKWSFLRALSYFFGNRDVFEELERLRGDNFALRERLLEKNRVRPLSQTQPDSVELKEPAPPDDFQSWELRRKAEILEEQALFAAKEPMEMERVLYNAEIDPETWLPVVMRAVEIHREIAAGTYLEPQER